MDAPAATHHERMIASGDALLWSCSTGSGVPLLLCNGGPGCCDYLEPVAALIDDLAHVIRWEPRGCGRSSAHPPYDLDTCIRDIESIRIHHRIDRWIVAGHSWGPDLALAYALAHPDRVLGLIGISGGVIHRDRQWHDQYRSAKDADQIPAFAFPPNLAVNRSLNASTDAFNRQPALLRRLARLDIPALYLSGEHDIRPHWPVEQLAHLLPHGRFVLIPGAGHLIWTTHADALSAELRGFITHLSSSPDLS